MNEPYQGVEEAALISKAFETGKSNWFFRSNQLTGFITDGLSG
ncbi:MAG: hypothetical protein ACKVJU_24075 [Verrucomicrobiales bacterium]